MIRKITILMVAVSFCIFVAHPVAFARGRGKKSSLEKARRLKKVQEHLTDNEHAILAIFVLGKLSIGIKGEKLAGAIHVRLNAIKKARHEKKGKKDDSDKKGPGEALRHGLEDKDLVGLGKFVNEKLAEGLRGKNLSEAIREESDKRKEQRKKEREAKKAEKKNQPKGGRQDKSDKPGKGGGQKGGRGL